MGATEIYWRDWMYYLDLDDAVRECERREQWAVEQFLVDIKRG